MEGIRGNCKQSLRLTVETVGHYERTDMFHGFTAEREVGVGWLVVAAI